MSVIAPTPHVPNLATYEVTYEVTYQVTLDPLWHTARWHWIHSPYGLILVR